MFWFPSCLIMSTINLLESTAKQNHPMLNISQSLLIYRFFLWLFCYRHTGHLSLFCIFWTYPIASSCNCHVPLSPVSPCIRHVPLSPVFPENLDINLEIHVWFFFFFWQNFCVGGFICFLLHHVRKQNVWYLSFCDVKIDPRVTVSSV